MAKSDKKISVSPRLYDIIVSPIVTEKTQGDIENNKIAFYVAPSAKKPEIKEAVEKVFEVKVEKINVINVKGKTKRFRGTMGKRKDRKKAIVSLAEGQNIDSITNV